MYEGFTADLARVTEALKNEAPRFDGYLGTLFRAAADTNTDLLAALKKVDSNDY